MSQQQDQSPSRSASWVELYFDLVFVLAVAQVAHTVAGDSSWRGVAVAFGLFALLWWTWIGFAVLYNRHGDSAWQRLLVIAATVPCGIAAVSVHGASVGEFTPFALSMAGSRLLLAIANAVAGGRPARNAQWRVAAGYLFSAVGFGVSVLLPVPWPLWAVLVISESANLLKSPSRRELRENLRHRDVSRSDVGALLRSTDPADALDSRHLSERFGLFMIILLGEVVASAGQGMLASGAHGAVTWLTLSGGIAMAGALWWLYFDSAAEFNERLLEWSGGSPMMAKGLFASGHMVPAFGLVLVAAGLGRLLTSHGVTGGFWLLAVGLGLYLAGTRSVLSGPLHGLTGRLVNLGLIAATFLLGFVAPLVSGPVYVWMATGWTVVCAALATVGARVRADHWRQHMR